MLACEEWWMSGFDPKKYGETIADLILPARIPPLDPGRPNQSARASLHALADDTNFLGKPIRDRQMADACRAGLWLYHDFLDESHSISQEIHNTAGSYWHGMMHRREPDYANSGYWFRKVGKFATFDELAEAARQIVGDSNAIWASFLKNNSKWDPYAFNDLCENALSGRVNAINLCQQIQQREWELLFDYCYRAATGYE